MCVFHLGDDGGGEIVDSRSWACGRTVHHVQASLIRANADVVETAVAEVQAAQAAEQEAAKEAALGTS